jgi:hypothetical protein
MLAAEASEPDYPAMIQALGKTVADNFYDPNMRGVDWVRVTRDYARRAKAVSDDAAFRRLATEMMGTLKASHTDISAPAANTPQSRPPIVLEENVLVDVAELSHARAQGLRPGFRVLNEAMLAGPLGSVADVRVLDCAGVERTVHCAAGGGAVAAPRGPASLAPDRDQPGQDARIYTRGCVR